MDRKFIVKKALQLRIQQLEQYILELKKQLPTLKQEIDSELIANYHEYLNDSEKEIKTLTEYIKNELE